MATMGKISIGAANDAPAGYFDGFWFQANSSGILTGAKICCWCTSVKWVKVAIYTNAGSNPPGTAYPGTLVANNQVNITQTTKPTVDGEWLSMNLSGSITGGAYYWLCLMVYGDGDEYIAYDIAAANSQVQQSYDPASFPPATAPTANWTYDVGQGSVYALYTETGGSTTIQMIWTR